MNVDDLPPFFRIMAIRTVSTRPVMIYRWGRMTGFTIGRIISVVKINVVPPGREVAIIALTDVVIFGCIMAIRAGIFSIMDVLDFIPRFGDVTRNAQVRVMVYW